MVWNYAELNQVDCVLGAGHRAGSRLERFAVIRAAAMQPVCAGGQFSSGNKGVVMPKSPTLAKEV